VSEPVPKATPTHPLWVPQLSRTFRKSLLRRGETRIEHQRLPEGSTGAVVLVE